jgi:hypothetical protein
MTRLFVSKRRSRAAHDYSRVIPAQAGIQSFSVSRGGRPAATGNGVVIPVARGEDRDSVPTWNRGGGLRRGDGA